MPQFKVKIIKSLYREVIITADDDEQAFDMVEENPQTYWERGIESCFDDFQILDNDIEEI